MGSNPTIKDVAKKAGVSITTVSFVLNNRKDVAISEEVKKKVIRVARELDYHPSAMAAGLAGKRTRNLGVVFYQQDSSISNPFYSFVIEGMVKETIDKGFNLYFSYLESAYDGYQSFPKIIREKNVDGIILIARSDPKMVADLRDRKIPVVAVDTYPALKGADSIQVDNKQGGLIATEHLIQLGHKQIGFLTIPKGRPSIDERGEGWRHAHLRNSLKLNEQFLLECGSLSFQGGYEGAKEALQRHKKMTALFCANDEMAAGALRAAREAGKKVPKDFSVVGFDCIVMSAYTDPPLTTISAPKEYMGKLAIARLLEIIESKEWTPRKQDVPVELIVRQSTAKPA
jgi:LacI family transcriptional regulator